MWSDNETLKDIARACSRIELFIQGMSADEFLVDLKTQAAVQHQLLVLGEAAKRISDAFQLQHPEIPWSLMARTRDKLIHSYDLIIPAEIWRTATVDIPSLLALLEPLL